MKVLTEQGGAIGFIKVNTADTDVSAGWAEKHKKSDINLIIRT